MFNLRGVLRPVQTQFIFHKMIRKFHPVNSWIGNVICIKISCCTAKLPVSRLQRDLTDSTVLRNLGVPFAHTLISFKSILKGFGKLIINKEAIDSDLEDNWAVIAEAVQTILRREAYPNPYEALKELTRTNSAMTKKDFEKFIDALKVDKKVKDELRKLSPFNYTGVHW